jgi:hypothetical protein
VPELVDRPNGAVDITSTGILEEPQEAAGVCQRMASCANAREAVQVMGKESPHTSPNPSPSTHRSANAAT